MTDKHPRHDKRDYPARMRPFVDLLCLWRLCTKPACSRARACRGDARVCFLRQAVLLPEGVQDWYEGLRDAQANGKPFNDAMEELDATDAGEALRDWHAAVWDSLGEEGSLQAQWWTIDQR